VNLLARTPPRPSSPDAERGTRAHEILEIALTNGFTTAAPAIDESNYCLSPEIFNTDDRASINDALDFIWDLMAEIDLMYGDPVIFIERYVNPPVDAAPGEAAGFCDIAIYSARARRLWVMDYKHGAGISKAVIGNPQVKQYAAGFLYEDNPAVDPANVDVVTLVIIQPRAFHPDGDIRQYDITPAELFDYLMNLDEIIEDCLKPDAPLTPGVDQCRFCDARTTCPAAEKAAVAVANQHFASIRDVAVPRLPDVRTLDGDRLAYIVAMKGFVKSWFDACEQQAEDMLRAGVPVGDLKLVEANPKREWYGTDEDDIATRLSAVVGCKKEDLFRKSLITITDAESLITQAFKARVGRGQKKQAAEDAKHTFAYFTLKKSSGNLTMVSADDPRPAVNKALNAFSGISGLLPPPSQPTKEE
jgi:hypothetical protein